MSIGRIRVRVEEREQRDDVEENRYEFGAEISNDLLDSYYTVMDDSTLRNFVRDAKSGVSFLEGHDIRRMPYGQTFNARIDTLDDRKRVLADIYTIRGIEFGGMSFASTDMFIRAIEHELVRDVSVGFYDGTWRCDLCGKDVFDFSDWETMCRHWPGVEYEENDETVLATATIEDARLSEVSIVYDGATPEAMLTEKSKISFQRGFIGEKDVVRFNHLYNLRMSPMDWEQPPVRIKERTEMSIIDLLRESGIDGVPVEDEEDGVKWLINRIGEDVKKINEVESSVGTLEADVERLNKEVTDNQGISDNAETVLADNERLTDANKKLEAARKLDENLTERVNDLTGEKDGLQVKVDELTDEVGSLQELSKLGVEVRNEVIDIALKSGVRAFGDKFNSEAQKTLLEKMDLELIREMGDQWELTAKNRLPVQRQTVDNSVDDGDVVDFRSPPPSLYGINMSD